jgi:hypothetical protein
MESNWLVYTKGFRCGLFPVKHSRPKNTKLETFWVTSCSETRRSVTQPEALVQTEDGRCGHFGFLLPVFIVLIHRKRLARRPHSWRYQYSRAHPTAITNVTYPCHLLHLGQQHQRDSGPTPILIVPYTKLAPTAVQSGRSSLTCKGTCPPLIPVKKAGIFWELQQLTLSETDNNWLSFQGRHRRNVSWI